MGRTLLNGYVTPTNWEIIKAIVIHSNLQQLWWLATLHVPQLTMLLKSQRHSIKGNIQQERRTKMIISTGEVILASERTCLGSHLEKMSLRMTSHNDNFT